MSAQALLDRLERARKVAPGRWAASCPTTAHAHGDRSRGLSVTELPDGRVLACCHAGCATFDVLAAAGFSDWSELFPDAPLDPTKPGKRLHRPVIPAQVFETARFEVGVVAVIASDMHRGRAISDPDYQRLNVAMARLERIAEAAYGR